MYIYFKKSCHTSCIYINIFSLIHQTLPEFNCFLSYCWYLVYFPAGSSFCSFSPNIPTLLRVEIDSISLIPLFSIAFSPFTVRTACLCSDIFKPSPWGEQKSASIWNQLFHSAHESRTKPRQKKCCQDRRVICFQHSCRLLRYQSVYCASALQPWMWRGAWSFAAHQSCHNNAMGRYEISQNCHW